jgi:acetyltransferase-like isoleucine patch superfamily enzyme
MIKSSLRRIRSLALIISGKFLRRQWSDCIFGSGVAVDSRTMLEGRNRICDQANVMSSMLGLASYVGPGTRLINCEIGRWCSIAGGVSVVVGRHPTKNFVSTHPAFFSTQEQAGFSFTDKTRFEEFKYAEPLTKRHVMVGHDVWIGEGATLIAGVRIGTGAVIAAGAIVTKDVLPYQIVGGIPARVIGARFEPPDIAFLLETEWWNRDFEWIRSNAHHFHQLDEAKRILANPARVPSQRDGITPRE